MLISTFRTSMVNPMFLINPSELTLFFLFAPPLKTPYFVQASLERHP